MEDGNDPDQEGTSQKEAGCTEVREQGEVNSSATSGESSPGKKKQTIKEEHEWDTDG